MSMLRRSDASHHAKRMNVSFEFFPPKTGDMESQLWESISRLAPYRPDFVSVTYGAGGTTRQPTLNTVRRILDQTDLAPAAHLTCVGATREQVDEVVREFAGAGVRHFVALRGDPAGGIGSAYAPHPGGYANGADLVGGLRAISDFEVSVSAYPEKHPESPDFATDIDLLKRKVDNGATRAITQFFFDNDTYERYVERVRRAGIYVPIVPGILPVHSFPQVARFAGMCGATVPSWLGGTLRRPGERRADACDGCRGGGSGPGDGPRRARRARLPFLHHEPGAARLRHLPSSRLAWRRRQRHEGRGRGLAAPAAGPSAGKSLPSLEIGDGFGFHPTSDEVCWNWSIRRRLE